MIDVDVSFVNISANNDNNNSPLGQNFGQILVEFRYVGDNKSILQFWPNFLVFKCNFSPIYGLQCHNRS